MKLINKDVLVAEIDRLENKLYYEPENFKDVVAKMALDSLKSFLDTLEVKEIGLTDGKTDWRPSKKQMESLRDLLKYNIGVFDYQKFMEVNSLYDNLTKICDYEIDR